MEKPKPFLETEIGISLAISQRRRQGFPKGLGTKLIAKYWKLQNKKNCEKLMVSTEICMHVEE